MSLQLTINYPENLPDALQQTQFKLNVGWIRCGRNFEKKL